MASCQAFHRLPGTRRTGGSSASLQRRSSSRSSPSRARAARARRRRGSGGTVVYGTRNEPPCFNVLVPVCSSVDVDGRVPGLVFRGAYKPDPRNTLQPDLDSNVEFTRTAPFTLTYHIRPEAHWSDEVEISAQDFVFQAPRSPGALPSRQGQLDARPDHGSERPCTRSEDCPGRPLHAHCGLARPVR